MSLLVLFLLILPSSSFGCYLYNVDYVGTNLNGEHQIRTTSAATCQKMCQQNQNCVYFTWLSNDFADPAYRQDCYLKAAGALIANKQGAISGPRDCGTESCCDELTLETWGMADFYQGERLGKYSKVGTSSDGRFVFKQDGGDNYLYYLSQNGYWMVGHEIGVDKGGLMNRGSGFCAEDSTQPWLYWADWMEEWKEDSDLEAKCNNGE